jgi:hypothetical protein
MGDIGPTPAPLSPPLTTAQHKFQIVLFKVDLHTAFDSIE